MCTSLTCWSSTHTPHLRALVAGKQGTHLIRRHEHCVLSQSDWQAEAMISLITIPMISVKRFHGDIRPVCLSFRIGGLMM